MACVRGLIGFAIFALVTFEDSVAVVGRGGLQLNNPWNPSHIAVLPVEVREVVERSTRACGAVVAARRLFSTYIRDRVTGYQFIALHFNEIRCANRSAVCTALGCLQEVFASNGRSYKLVLSVHADNLELKDLGTSVGIEMDCARSTERCSRLLRWNGSRFIPAGN